MFCLQLLTCMEMEGVGGRSQVKRQSRGRGRGVQLTPTVTAATSRPQRWRPIDQEYEVLSSDLVD